MVLFYSQIKPLFKYFSDVVSDEHVVNTPVAIQLAFCFYLNSQHVCFGAWCLQDGNFSLWGMTESCISRQSLTTELEARWAFKATCLTTHQGVSIQQLLTSWECMGGLIWIWGRREEARWQKVFAAGNMAHHGSMSTSRANVIMGKVLC